MQDVTASDIFYLAIDPSINNVGWAGYKDGLFTGGTIDLSEWDSLPYKSDYLIRQLLKMKPHTVIYEEATFQASAKGKIAAQKGYIINLGFIAGYVAGALHLHPADIYGYTPMQWKGSVPKSATYAKYRRYINLEKIKYSQAYHNQEPTEHEIDATMLLVHHLGL